MTDRPGYLLPIRCADGEPIAELTGYLRTVAGCCDVIVVDGSAPPVFQRNHAAWRGFARHLPPDPRLAYGNGKVNGVLTGMRVTAAARVVIADDDVRYDRRSLAAVLALLDRADLVIPQNYFDPLPWHAAWDSARSLINRSLGGDYPGTLAVRRAAFHGAGCYDGDVLFENLELVRTMRAAGARVVAAPHILVPRRPPRPRHFARQRVRQAYDSLAQPGRLAVELALLPGVLTAGRRRPAAVAAVAGVGVLLAEAGRRRAGGSAVFPGWLSLLAPAWLAERSVCSWLALACRARGGVRYAGGRLRRAATSTAVLRRRARRLGLTAAGRAEPRPYVAAVAEGLHG
ncbi:MAG: hypothetical protein V7637_6665 [Mycobacteriales bacterium]|jgi:hypothetical protein